MHGLIIKPENGVQPFNPHPGTDPTVTRSLSFESHGYRYEIVLQVPIYIHEKLVSADWDFVRDQVTSRADVVIRAAALQGDLFLPETKERIKADLLNMAKGATRGQFMKHQERAGNYEGHLVARSLEND